MNPQNFDQQFDEGVDITPALDIAKAKRVRQTQKRVNVDFPMWMLESLDREASMLGVCTKMQLNCNFVQIQETNP